MIPVIHFVSIANVITEHLTENVRLCAVPLAVDIQITKQYNEKVKEPRKGDTRRGFCRRNRWVLLFLGIYLLLSVLSFDLRLYTGGDNATYIILAESLITGRGYSDIHLPEESPHTKFPVGLPLLLSVPVFLFGYNLLVLKLAVFIMGIVGFFFVYKTGALLCKNTVNLVMILYVSIPLLYVYNHYVLSEIPYLCFSVAAVYLFMKARKNQPVLYYLSFALAVYSYLIRAVGIALVIAMIAVLLVRKEYQYVIILLFMFLAVFIPWQIRNARVPQAWTYANELFLKNPYNAALGKISVIDFIVRLWENFILYTFTIIPQTMVPVIKSPVILAISGFLFLMFMILGFAGRIRRFTVIEVYFVISIAITLSWPKIWSSSRFLVPLMLFLIFYFSAGIFWAARRINSMHVGIVILVTIAVLNSIGLFALGRQALRYNATYLTGDKYAGYPPADRNYFEAIDYIEDNVPKNKVIIARKPQFVYLISRCKSFKPSTADIDARRAALLQSDYLIAGKLAKDYFGEILNEERSNYDIVFLTEEPRYYVLKMKR